MANQFLIKHPDGRVEGPLTATQLCDGARAGSITPATLVQQVGLAAWHPATRVPKLASIFTESGSVPPPVPAPSPPVTVPQPAVPPPPPAPEAPADGFGAQDPDDTQLGLGMYVPKPDPATALEGGAVAFASAAEAAAPAASARGNQSPRPSGLGDRILQATFTFARSISVLVIFASVLIVIGGAITAAYALLPGPSTEGGQVDRPNLTQFEESCRIAAQSSTNDRPRSGRSAMSGSLGEIDECAAFRDRIQSATGALGLDQRATDILCGQVTSLPKTYQLPFMDGLVALSESWAQTSSKPANCDGADAANWYVREFRDRVMLDQARIAREQKEAAERRELFGPSLNAIGTAIACLLVFLVLPLLIQIERNTRLAAPA